MASPEISPRPLHDALPIYRAGDGGRLLIRGAQLKAIQGCVAGKVDTSRLARSPDDGSALPGDDHICQSSRIAIGGVLSEAVHRDFPSPLPGLLKVLGPPVRVLVEAVG